MLRKALFSLAAAALVCGATHAPVQAKSYNTVSNLSQVQVQGQMALDIFKQIETMTQGRVKLVWHDAGDLIPAISQVPATELYLAMDRGRIDAMEFSSPALDESWGFDKLAPHYYFPGWHQPVGWQWLLFNKKAWDKLSKEYQNAIMQVCYNNLMANYYKLLALDK